MKLTEVDRAMISRSHPWARIDTPVEIGERTRIWGAHVMAGARIGDDCVIGDGVHIGPNVVIGDGCRIQNGAQLFDGVTLADQVFIGPHVVFTNVRLPRAFVSQKDAFESTFVGRGASVGANATVVCGRSIGEYAMVGAGSVVTKDVGAYELVTGNPARNKIAGYGDAGCTRFVCRCGEPLIFGRDWRGRHDGRDAISCAACGSAYTGVDTNWLRIRPL